MKTKPVSCSNVGGEGTAVKRTSQHLTPEDEDESSEDPPAPRKVSKIGFSMSSPLAKKSNPISIKLGATVSVSQWTLCKKNVLHLNHLHFINLRK